MDIDLPLLFGAALDGIKHGVQYAAHAAYDYANDVNPVSAVATLTTKLVNWSGARRTSKRLAAIEAKEKAIQAELEQQRRKREEEAAARRAESEEVLRTLAQVAADQKASEMRIKADQKASERRIKVFVSLAFAVVLVVGSVGYELIIHFTQHPSARPPMMSSHAIVSG